MSSLLFLNTRDSDGGNNYETFWHFARPDLNMPRAFTLSLKNVEFPNTVYPINEFNQNVYFNEGAATLTATLTPNDYTGAQFATEIKTRMDAAGGQVYTVTYDAQSKKLTLSAPGNFQLESGANDALEEMGFETLVSSTSMTSDYPINISGSAFMDVVVDIANRNFSTSTSSHVLCRVPLNVSFGQLVFYEPPSHAKMFISKERFDQLYISLRDDRGKQFKLPNNAYLSLVLLMEESMHSTHNELPSSKRLRFE
jgi:hypothetical protein